jgi:hypothetical protein
MPEHGLGTTNLWGRKRFGLWNIKDLRKVKRLLIFTDISDSQIQELIFNFILNFTK